MKTQNEHQSMNQMVLLNEDEIFYKNYYQASQSASSLKEFLKTVDIDDVIAKHLVVPDLLPEIISYDMPDSEYFSDEDDKNVLILKHNRYTPIFFHKHDFFEIVFVFSGFCNQNIDMERKHFVEGDLIFIAPGIYHTMEVFTDDSIILNVLLRKKTFYQMFTPLMKGNDLLSVFFSEGLYNSQQIKYVTFHLGEKNLIAYQQQMMNLYKEQLYHDEYSDQILIGTLTAFISRTMREDQDKMEYSYKSNDLHTREDFKVMSYIQEHIATITLTEIADHFGFSTAYCSRLIKKSTGLNFNKWKTIIRIRQAQYMLHYTHSSIEDISADLGYENTETFIRTFKKEVHTTPAKYRKQINNRQTEK